MCSHVVVERILFIMAGLNLMIYFLMYFRCASIVSRFLDLDLERDNVVGFLQEFVLPSAKDIL